MVHAGFEVNANANIELFNLFVPTSVPNHARFSIKKTPMPFAMVVHLRTGLMLWLISLPLVLYKYFGESGAIRRYLYQRTTHRNLQMV